jgi:pre-rRNA-processing protein TSR4
LAAKSPQPPHEPPTETSASKLRISSTPPKLIPHTPEDTWPPDSAFPKPFTCLHLDAEYESLVPEKAQIPSTSSLSNIQAQYVDEDGAASNGLDKDLFESSLDKTFLKFSDRLAQNPEQVLRYEWKGTPLLYSATDNVGRRLAASNTKTKTAAGMPRCESCGAERVFEMQLVPGAIVALEEEDVNLEEGMEWGTIIVGVCERNCGEFGAVVFKEEWCGVQWEERG